VQFHVDTIIRRAEDLVAKDFFERLAINRTGDQIFLAHRAITKAALAQHGGEPDPFTAWAAAHSGRISLTLKTISELLAEKSFDLAKLSVAQGLLWDLAATRS
jgi:glutamate dehydrogenase